MMQLLHWLRDHLSPERRGRRQFDPVRDDTIVCLRAQGIDSVRATKQAHDARKRIRTFSDDLFPINDRPRKDAR